MSIYENDCRLRFNYGIYFPSIFLVTKVSFIFSQVLDVNDCLSDNKVVGKVIAIKDLFIVVKRILSKLKILYLCK